MIKKTKAFFGVGLHVYIVTSSTAIYIVHTRLIGRGKSV